MAERVRFGLFAKLLLFSLCITLIPLGVVAYMAFSNMSTVGELLLQKGKAELESLGAKIIEEKARGVAQQMALYIKAHPNKTLADLQRDPEFQKIAVQPVGKTGYTAVFHGQSFTTVFHKSHKIVGMNMHKIKQKLPAVWKMFKKASEGKDAFGYYKWQEPDGRIRDKYMFLKVVPATPADGALLAVGATTYVDEFSRPWMEWERTVSSLIGRQMRVFVALILATAALVILASYLLARSITKPILYLARVADQISMGKLGTEIELSSRDEIGVLIASMKRMQKSLSMAIRKLREQRRG